MSDECGYVVNGNLCSNQLYCEDKTDFRKPVTIDEKPTYGVCNKASVF